DEDRRCVQGHLREAEAGLFEEIARGDDSLPWGVFVLRPVRRRIRRAVPPFARRLHSQSPALRSGHHATGRPSRNTICLDTLFELSRGETENRSRVARQRAMRGRRSQETALRENISHRVTVFAVRARTAAENSCDRK